MPSNSPQPLVDKLRFDLLEARKARDQLTTTTLQSVLTAIDNAGAIPIPENINPIDIGSTEASRRELSAQDIHELVMHEIIELQQAIQELGDKEESYVDELNKRMVILENYVTGSPS